MRRKSVNERQLEVLRWIGEGCPPRDWPDHSYKTSALALQGRGLVVVERRRGSWSATITDDGRYYVEHGDYRPEPPTTRPAGAASTALSIVGAETGSRRPEVDATALIEELRAAGGTVRIEDPDPARRAAYRRAINAAITSGKVPDGQRLRHTGRDRGDLIIRMVAQTDPPPKRETPPAIAVPDTLDDPNEVVAALADRDDLDVSDQQRPRMLRIVQGIVDEAQRRGYTVVARPDQQPGLRIVIGEDTFDLFLWEEQEKVDRYPDDEIEAAAYPWQRVRLQQVTVPSGRLVLRLDDTSYRPPWWADRRRWSLVDKLPDMFALIDDRTRHAREQRERLEQQQQQRHQQWQTAVVDARQRHLEELNRTRILEQVDAWRRAADLRAYARHLQALAHAAADHTRRAQLNDWATWAHDTADRIDPTNDPETLRYLVPDDIDPDDLDRHMPSGMTVRHPPPPEQQTPRQWR